jgi:imidazolonepropionase
MATWVLRDIGELLTAAGPTETGATRSEQVARAESALGLVQDATLVVIDGKIHFAGPSHEAPAIHLLPQPVMVQTARGQLVTPGLCDPHTHLLWAGDRSREFDLRNLGASYQTIAAQGGGIVSTVRSTSAASDEDLSSGLRARLYSALQLGTTACEVKSGYGLWPNAELRLLQLISAVAHDHPCAVSPTFLCHVPPPEALEGSTRARLLMDLATALPAARTIGAEAVDVYCDVGAFTLAETLHLLETGKLAGLGLRCHAEQFTYTGAAAAAARLGALSVEHLEQLDGAGRAALAASGTIANLLPGAALTLRLPWPDAAALRHDGVRIALGTDCNPGSSYSQSQPLMMSLACTQMGLSCAEAWLAVTLNAAHSIGHRDRGQLRVGDRADVVLWEAEHYRQVCQQLGGNPVRSVWVGGRQYVRDGLLIEASDSI